MRRLSTAAMRSLFTQETDLVWLLLLTISHDDLETPIRVVNNSENVMSRSNTFLAYPFQIMLPQERDDAPPSVTLTIDNVDQRIIAAIRGLSAGIKVTLEVVCSSDFNHVEVGPFNFEVSQIRYDSLTITGDLTFEPVLDEPYPGTHFTPSGFPGLF